MVFLGLSKRAKEQFISYKSNRSMRRCKSTGNIYTTTTTTSQDVNSDSSISSNESDTDDKMKITQKMKDLKVVDLNQTPVEKVKKSDQRPQSILNVNKPNNNNNKESDATIKSLTTKKEDIKNIKPTITISTDEKTTKVASCPTSPINTKPLTTTTSVPTKIPADQNNKNHDLIALLSLEAQERIDAQLNRENEASKPLRPTTLKFALPETPERSRSKSPIVYPRARPYRSRSAESADHQRRHVSPSRNSKNKNNSKKSSSNNNSSRKRQSRWSRLMGSDDDDSDSSDDTHPIKLEIGTKVNLFKRPLPTMGYIRYMGPIDNEIGQWVGVELDHRVGNCDGSLKGKSYFKTAPQRGIFLKETDIEPVN
ncbi:unnamed protein product [Cunninghamella blakesleeana]